MNKKDKEEIVAEFKRLQYNGHLRFFILVTLIGIVNLIVYHGLK